MKTLLFIIDMQNDFCKPEGALYVPGAEKDVQRLSDFITQNINVIDGIILTQDNHQVMDIAHPCFWINEKNEHPAPYTSISYEDVINNKWIPVLHKEKAVSYLKQLEASGEYAHTIWPEHCIWGSEGAAIHQVLMQAIASWARSGRMFGVISKGTNPLTEHFGAFRANVPLQGQKETQFNDELLEQMKKYDRIYVAGEAKSHCVANSIRQLFDYPELFPKMILLEDCMSNVTGFDEIALPVYEKAKKLGAKVMRAKIKNKE